MADNKSIQKVFGLSDFRKKQLLGEIPERTREAFREYGYFCGGATPGPVSTVDRIDYSNDTATASVRGPLSLSLQGLTSTGNSNFGYFGGEFRCSIYRINYSNDLAIASTRGSFTTRKLALTSTGNSNFGYFGGGNGPISTVDRVDYSNDLATASNRGPLSLPKRYLSATGNSNFGYFGGGYNQTSTVQRINYSNDNANALVRGNLFSGRDRLSATGNSNFGYFGGGWGNARSTIDRIDYSNDLIRASIRGPLSQARTTLAATGNSNFGYFGGGSTSIPSPVVATVERIDYSNDTITPSFRGPLSSARRYLAATSSHSFGGTPNSSFASNFTFPTVPNAGYFGGGTDGTNNFASIDKVDYANDTATASVRSALSSARQQISAIGNSNFGYFAGNNPTSSIVDRLEYVSDTQNVTTRGSLQVASFSRAAVGNQSYGYVNGGSAINRIDYSNDSSTSNRGNLLNANLTFAWSSISSPYYGYFTGGYSAPTTYSGLDRIDFANDTLTASKRTNVPNVNYGMSGFGNQSFGYIGGGINLTYVRRVDYANDTANISFRGPLSRNINYLSSATSNSNFGYFGGGTAPSIPRTSQVDRINYSNDTAIAQIRGPLPVAKSALGATSPLAYGGAPIYFTNPLPQVFQDQIEFDDSNTLDLPFKRVLGSFGYFGGGNGPLSRVDRIDYSNDTTSASVRGSLNVSTEFHSALGNSNFGYYIGGTNFQYSYIQRVDYSNDLSTTSNRGNDVGRRLHCSVGNQNFGYIIGGDGGAATQIRKFNYSNDTANTSLIGSFTPTRRASAATGNSNFGYIAGGNFQPTVYSTVERLNFSNDTTKTLVRGPLSSTRYSHSATGNNNFGWFGGGSGPNVSIVDRIDYSNDTSIASVRGPIIGRQDSAATGNSNFGYFGGGSRNGPNIADISRIDYSNDLATATIRGPLSLARGRLAATTNARNS